MQDIDGGIKIIPGSQSWGCIPNRQRAPYEIPEEAEITELEPKVMEGDVFLFHSMILHSTADGPQILM